MFRVDACGFAARAVVQKVKAAAEAYVDVGACRDHRLRTDGYVRVSE